MGSQNVLSYLNRENEKPYLSQRRSSPLNPISGRLLATPISGKGGLFRTPP